MALSQEQERRFNEAAAQARAEFEAHWQDWSAGDVGRWIEKWYERTAYDRLCRIIRDVTGKAEARQFYGLD